MNNQMQPNRKSTFLRSILFCAASAFILALFSGIFKGLPNEWSQHLLLLITILISLALTVLFTRWEGLTLKDLGVLPGSKTASRLVIGFFIGSIFSLLQPALVMLSGDVSLVYNSDIAIDVIVSNFLLFLLIACREEIAFRGYPLRSLAYAVGPIGAQLIIGFIFSLEHIAGGMTLLNAFIGSGIGAILFGLAALRTRGLALSTGLHLAWNFGQWVIGFKGSPGIWKAIVEKGQEAHVEMIGLICYVAVMTSLIIGIYYFYPKDDTSGS